MRAAKYTMIAVLLGGAAVYAIASKLPEAPEATLEVLPASIATPLVEFIEPYKPATRTFIEVTDGCGPDWSGACVNLRSGPGTEYPALLKLRTGTVLLATSTIEAEGRTWYKVGFDEWLRYPDRLPNDLYVAADFVRAFEDEGSVELAAGVEPFRSDKRIVVDRSEQKLYAYEGDRLFMEESVSTGLDLTPTPRGQFTIFRKTPSRYMQGPIPDISDDLYDLPGVPWNLYFTHQGGAIHGAYWHDSFGEQWSHGCVNMPLDKARQLYEWAELGTPVTVRD